MILIYIFIFILISYILCIDELGLNSGISWEHHDIKEGYVLVKIYEFPTDKDIYFAIEVSNSTIVNLIDLVYTNYYTNNKTEIDNLEFTREQTYDIYKTKDFEGNYYKIKHKNFRYIIIKYYGIYAINKQLISSLSLDALDQDPLLERKINIIIFSILGGIIIIAIIIAIIIIFKRRKKKIGFASRINKINPLNSPNKDEPIISINEPIEQNQISTQNEGKSNES